MRAVNHRPRTTPDSVSPQRHESNRTIVRTDLANVLGQHGVPNLEEARCAACVKGGAEVRLRLGDARRRRLLCRRLVCDDQRVSRERRESDRERDRQRQTGRERDTQRQTEAHTERKGQTEKHRGRQREKGTHRDTQRHTQRERDRQRNTEADRERKGHTETDRPTDRHTDTQTE